jgi:hypothetical protein
MDGWMDGWMDGLNFLPGARSIVITANGVLNV